MITARTAIESLYQDTCAIVEYQAYKKQNKSTGYTESTVLSNQPCRLSYSASKTNTETDAAEAVAQSVKLFIAPEITVKPGSKITVSHLGRLLHFSNSGLPAVYETHQEIVLTPFKGWA